MPIESKLRFKGFTDPLSGVFTRVISVHIDTQSGHVLLKLKHWSSKEAARKVLSTKLVDVPDPDYDPKNPEHVAKWEAAGRPGNEFGAWKPTFGRQELVTYWDGYKTVEEPIQESEVLLSHELALAVAAQSVEGDTPKPPLDALEAMTSQLYLAAMQTGAVGEDPVAVVGPDPIVEEHP